MRISAARNPAARPNTIKSSKELDPNRLAPCTETHAASPANFLRHYYDVYSLLSDITVQKFIGTEAYQRHKDKRFRSENPIMTENEAFLLNELATFNAYDNAYESTRSLYYRDRPTFTEILKQIKQHAAKL